MSVTKNANRIGTLDFFETPAHATRALLTHPVVAAIVADRTAPIVEHAAGAGAILRVLRDAGVAREQLAAIEIEESHRASLDALAGAVYCPEDTLIASRALSEQFDLAVTNPPFKTFDGADGVAAFARAGLRLVRPGGLVALLGRHDWILPLDRDAPLTELGYPDVCGLVRRCSFIRIATCGACGERWTSGANTGPARINHPTTTDRPGDASLERIAKCARVGTAIPAPKSSDTNGYAWFLWWRGEKRDHGRHVRLREPGARQAAKQGRLPMGG